jgi:hypothetical protein
MVHEMDGMQKPKGDSAKKVCFDWDVLLLPHTCHSLIYSQFNLLYE